MVAELVHGIVFATGLQRGFAGEVFFVVVANIRTGHVLVFHAGNAVADFFTLHVFHISQHALVGKIAFGQCVGRQSGGVVSGQSNQVVENAGFAGSISLKVRIFSSASLAKSVLS